jgi:hypothetical protein
MGFDHTRLFTAEAPTVFTRWIASWRKNTSKRREGMADSKITFGGVFNSLVRLNVREEFVLWRVLLC